MKYSKTAQNIWNCADQRGNLYKLSLLTQVGIILENKKTKKKKSLNRDYPNNYSVNYRDFEVFSLIISFYQNCYGWNFN